MCLLSLVLFCIQGQIKRQDSQAAASGTKTYVSRLIGNSVPVNSGLHT